MADIREFNHGFLNSIVFKLGSDRARLCLPCVKFGELLPVIGDIDSERIDQLKKETGQ